MIQLNPEIAAIKREMEGLFEQVVPFQEELESVQSRFRSLLAENDAAQAEQDLLLSQLGDNSWTTENPIDARLKVVQLESLVAYQRSIAQEVALEQSRAETTSRIIFQLEKKMTVLQHKMTQLREERFGIKSREAVDKSAYRRTKANSRRAVARAKRCNDSGLFSSTLHTA